MLILDQDAWYQEGSAAAKGLGPAERSMAAAGGPAAKEIQNPPVWSPVAAGIGPRGTWTCRANNGKPSSED